MGEMRNLPKLCIVIPCYNEEEVLPITAPLFLKKILSLINLEKLIQIVRYYLLMMEAKMKHGI